MQSLYYRKGRWDLQPGVVNSERHRADRRYYLFDDDDEEEEEEDDDNDNGGEEGSEEEWDDSEDEDAWWDPWELSNDRLQQRSGEPYVALLEDMRGLLDAGDRMRRKGGEGLSPFMKDIYDKVLASFDRAIEKLVGSPLTPCPAAGSYPACRTSSINHPPSPMIL